MKNDRIEICNIISEMLDNPDEHEIYPTTTAYNKLEKYVEEQRTLACRNNKIIVAITLNL